MFKTHVDIIVVVLFLAFRQCDAYSHCGRKRSECYAPGSVIPEEELKKHLGKVYQLPSGDYTGMVKCRGPEVSIDQKDGSLFRRDCCFIAVAGLAGRGISIQLLNYRNHYLRCRGGLCYIEVDDGSHKFKYDATFIVHMGLPSTKPPFSRMRPASERRISTQKSYKVLFESVTHPGFYIIHHGSRVRVSRLTGGSRQYASWVVIENNKYVTSAYRSVGCWKDGRARAIATLEGKDRRLNGYYKRRTHAIQKCYQAAKARGYRYFAVQHGGWCASSATAGRTYRRYGRSNRCRGGKGGFWANDVYIIQGHLGTTYHVSRGDSRQLARNKLIDIIGKALEDEKW